MGLRISTNMASLVAQRHIGQSQRQSVKAIAELASGSRFAGDSSNSADLSISEHLKGQVQGMKAAKMNADNANSFVQVAEGGLNEQNNILIRLRELAIQSASDTFSDTEREYIEMEFSELKDEFDRIAKTTQFGKQKLLAGEDRQYEFQVGSYNSPDDRIKFTLNSNTTAESVGIDDLSVADKYDARDSLEYIDEALYSISSARAHFGAGQSRLQIARDNLEVQIENVTEAQARISDTDVADAVARLAQAQIKQNFQASLLSQANVMAGNVMKLIPS